jgi:hypothetical protein
MTDDLEYEMYRALRSARFGLQAAGADVKVRQGAFVPTETLAFREVTEMLVKVDAARPDFEDRLNAETADDPE